MNPDPEAIGRRRLGREDCEVGDWVDAATAPEWSEELPSHVFHRAQISISPEDGGMGGMLPDHSEKWIFVGERRENQHVWVRES
jgi:hypothetical protein